MFFAPDQMRKRVGDWGREGLDRRFAEAWQAFLGKGPALLDEMHSAVLLPAPHSPLK